MYVYIYIYCIYYISHGNNMYGIKKKTSKQFLISRKAYTDSGGSAWFAIYFNFWLSCHGCHNQCHVSAAMSLLSCSGCPVPSVSPG